MKLKFEANQQYQLDAIASVVSLFEGQPAAKGLFEVDLGSNPQEVVTSLGRGNRLELDDAAILENLRRVQENNQLPVANELAGLNFTVEMETGTGKTYVYLRTILELHRKYGWMKFIIVVPSVAIREGVLNSLTATKDHFATLYGNLRYDFSVYDSKRPHEVRSFAQSTRLQILVINIDAFNKPANAVFHKPIDRLGHRKPVDFVQATRPVVVVDEPQNMESDKAKAAIASLAPLCTLRYSATHRDLYNLIYRLDPVQAYDLRLVKRIEVEAVLEEPDLNKPFILLEQVKATKSKVTAKLKIDVASEEGTARKKALPASLSRLSGLQGTA
jgi:type III restriction enzyme